MEGNGERENRLRLRRAAETDLSGFHGFVDGSTQSTAARPEVSPFLHFPRSVVSFVVQVGRSTAAPIAMDSRTANAALVAETASSKGTGDDPPSTTARTHAEISAAWPLSWDPLQISRRRPPACRAMER